MILLLGCSRAGATLPFTLEEVARVEHPTAIVEPAAGPRGLYVTEQEGRIWRVLDGKTTLVVDVSKKIVSGGERGLLGLAFAPRYPEDPRAFVNYTYEDRDGLHTRVAAYAVSADGARMTSEEEVLSFDQPYGNHNGGPLEVGPDGMLYVGVGDGGAGGDPRGTGQNHDDLLGSLLRIDVSTKPYRVPADNPFGNAVWAYGIRNPWGVHFDGDTLWFADVGQDRWEEIDRGVAGGNYGWNVMEGTHCYEARTCDASGFVAPIAEYGHDEGASVTGGVVYRGPSVPALDGRYVYADFSSGRFWTVAPEGGAPTRVGDSSLNPSTFGRDREGRLYIGDYGGGRILRVK